MKRYLSHVGVTALAALLTMTAVSATASPTVGATAPDFSGTDSHGTTHKLSDYRGSVVVLEWTNHDCPFVRKHYDTGNMQALQKYAREKGVIWLSVISSAPGRQGHVPPEEANRLTEARHASPSAVLLDPEGVIGKRYGAQVTPHMYIIDAQGTLVYMGGIDDKPTTHRADVKTAKNYVRVALDEVLSGQAVSNPVTRPYGCSVKY